uniref:C2H2-type domain-containing protein n=1 Tax=viral metagenome TaxID=1070528 RepID=A0A6C0J8Q7_9ZZZZ
MTEFLCNLCNYKTNLSSNFTRHIKTDKHIRNLLHYGNKPKSIKKCLINPPVLTQNDPKTTQNEPVLTHIEPVLTQNTTKSKKKVYFCEFCYKNFSTNSHLKRHTRQNCKVKKEQELKDIKENTDDKKEIAELKNQIQTLMNKVSTKSSHNNTHIGDTTINNTINLNVFGKENLEMVTDDIKKEMIKGPFKMMPKILELIYFNKKYPENHTMKLVNKNKELMKIHKKKGWELVDKVDTIDYLLEDKNYTLDSYYDTNTEIFSKMIKKTYNNFRNLFDSRDKELWKVIKRDVDLLLWNNM